MAVIKIGMASVDAELLLMVLVVVAYAIADPFFGPRALACIGAGCVVALLLRWRGQHSRMVTIDLRR
jgi:hypothetical protein